MGQQGSKFKERKSSVQLNSEILMLLNSHDKSKKHFAFSSDYPKKKIAVTILFYHV